MPTSYTGSPGPDRGGCGCVELPDDALLHILKDLPCERFTSIALVSKRFHRLTSSPNLLRMGVAAHINGKTKVERLRALRRWLCKHARHLQDSLEIAVGGPKSDKAAIGLELARCMVVAISGGTLRSLSVIWLGSTQLRLGPELAACSNTGALKQLTISGQGQGTFHMACPLVRLTAVEDMTLRGACKWEAGRASLPPSLTFLGLAKTSDANRSRLPPQLTALTALQILSIDTSNSQIMPDGFEVLTAIASLRHLTIVGCHNWPLDLDRLTALTSLRLRTLGLYDMYSWGGQEAAGPSHLQATLQALTRLESLVLEGIMPRPLDPSTALAGSSNLRVLHDASSCSPEDSRDDVLSALFLPDEWPEGLLAVLTDWPALVSSSWSSGVASEVQYICVRPETFDPGSHPHQPGWKAFWEWAAKSRLRLLEISGYAKRALEMVLFTQLTALRSSRPGIRICTTAPASLDHFLNTSDVVCPEEE